MTTTAEIPALGPSGYISQDSVLDKTGLYRNVWLTYQVISLLFNNMLFIEVLGLNIIKKEVF